MCNIPDEILEQLQRDITEIKVALLGNEYNPTGGLLYRTSENEKRIEALEKRIDKAYYMIVGASGVITVIINILAWLLAR